MRSVLNLLLVLISCCTVFAQQADFFKMTPEQRSAYLAKVRAASEVDWKAMLDQLGIRLPLLPAASEDPARPANLFQKPGSSNWYDSAGNTYVRSNWGSWSNYSESKTGNYTLPDPLVLKNGSRVSNADEWWRLRRPEILDDFSNLIYGKTPSGIPPVDFKVTEIDTKALNGKAIKKTITGLLRVTKYFNDTPRIEIILYIPAGAKGPMPLMVTVGVGFPGAFPGVKNNDTSSSLAMVIEKGWAMATVNTGLIQMDNGADLNKGIIGFMNQGKSRKADDWGALAAWCWGLSRALDYFETDPSINSKQIGIEGHSRWGKTALLAASLDQRWAIVYSSCSGSMGASLEKRNYGETIDNVAGAGEYHWMAGNFLKYAGHWQDMPVDAHELMTLIAPRPLFVTGGTQDRWADPNGEFLACSAASPVYQLLGKKGLSTTEMPKPDVSLIGGELAFREHDGGHSDLPDWPVFLLFAKRYFR
jgi:hypothetical protein